MGYHVVMPGEPGYAKQVPTITKDGGTASWRDAKRLLRQWYLNQASLLRNVTEKTYTFEE